MYINYFHTHRYETESELMPFAIVGLVLDIFCLICFFEMGNTYETSDS